CFYDTSNLEPTPSMNKRIVSFHLLFVLALSGTAFGATNYVVQDTNPQTQINASNPGDTIVMAAGPYTNDLIFSKPVTVLRTGTNDLIRFLGNVQIQGTGALNFAQVKFAGSAQIQ